MFNWKIITLQCCVGFCHMTMWISQKYTYVPSLLNLLSTPPSHPIPLGCHRAPAWAPCIIQLLPIVVVVQSYSTLYDHVDCSTPGFPVLHYLPEFAQTHVHWVSDAIQQSHSLLPPYLPALNLPHHQGLFQWVSSSHQVAKGLEFQLQHQSFQWTPRTDLL